MDNLNTIDFVPLVVVLGRLRDGWSRRSAAASRCAASCAFEPEPAAIQSSRSASLVGLVARPGRRCAASQLTGSQTRCSDGDPSAHRRGPVEVIEQNYFRDPDPRKLEDASDRTAWSTSSASATTTASPTTSTPRTLRDFEAQTSGQFSGDRPRRHRGQGRPAGRPGLRGHPGRGGRDRGRRRDHRGRRRVDRRASARRPPTAKIKGEPGTEVDAAPCARAAGGEPRRADVERADVRDPGRRRRGSKRVDGRQIAYVQLRTFSQGAHAELRDEIERSTAAGPRAWSSTCAATAAACSTRRVLDREHLRRGRRDRRDRGPHPAAQEYDAVGDALEPRPTAVLINGEHRLGGGDPRRGDRRLRPRRRRRRAAPTARAPSRR